MQSGGPVGGPAEVVAVRLAAHGPHLEPSQVQWAADEELVRDGDGLVRVDVLEVSAVEGALQDKVREQQRQVGLELEVSLEEAHVAAQPRALVHQPQQ